MTSKPASRAATAIISAPLEWPSRPALPTSMRGRIPWTSAHASTRRRTTSIRSPRNPSRWPSTPVGARYSPKTSRRVSAHSPVVMRARAQAIEAGLHVPRLDGREGATRLLDARHLLACGADELGDLRGDDGRAVEEVGVLEEVGLVGEDLLQAERPLLVPGARQAEGFVPCGQLERTAAGVAAERHAEGLDQDAPGVVLGLLLGEPERVHLQAVAEEAGLGVLDAVAIAGDLVPERGERPHLAHLLDEADAGVAEEGEPPQTLHELALAE